EGGPRHPPGHWLKQEVDRTRIDALTDAEVMSYCESDCRILLEGVLQARAYLEDRGARPGWTAGACALSLLQTLEPVTWRALKRHALPASTAIAAGACVRGARVEVWARGEIPTVHVYDWSSAYPASYATERIGIGARRLQPGDRDRPGSVWRCRWFWPHRDRIPPATDAVTGAGAGWCEAWLCEEERACFDEEEIHLQMLEGWAPACMFPVGQIFAPELFREKNAGSFFGKVYLNSLHGKFSESPIKTTWTRERPREWYGADPVMAGPYWRGLKLDADAEDVCRPHLQPLAAASILGRQRARLWRAIRDVVAAGGQVYYCDTDSIHTDLPPERMPCALGKGLGQLAYEGGPFRGIYLGPKSYALQHHETGAIKGACKGMPWASLADGVVKEGPRGRLMYRQARGEEQGRDLRLEAFRAALEEPQGVEIVKEGIASFAVGLRQRAGWSRQELPRTLQTQERSKRWGSSPTTWAYQTPAEVLRPKHADPPDFDAEPWADAPDGEPDILDLFD
ncbi:MAG: hypothetical protein RJA59_1806, partial [Pseudomonadota bacterium]